MPTRNGQDVGTRVVHRRYVPYSDAHYAGNLVDGAYSLKLFGDVATEMCILTDGDEGLFASYSDVQFVGPVRAGDVVEVEARLSRVGTRSRTARPQRHGRRAGRCHHGAARRGRRARPAAGGHHGRRDRGRPRVSTLRRDAGAADDRRSRAAGSLARGRR